jgi:H2-forming N5,N10-methylenetetrahydromethanopterin dehydrogenase-like enzyme
LPWHETTPFPAASLSLANGLKIKKHVPGEIAIAPMVIPGTPPSKLIIVGGCENEKNFHGNLL